MVDHDEINEAIEYGRYKARGYTTNHWYAMAVWMSIGASLFVAFPTYKEDVSNETAQGALCVIRIADGVVIAQQKGT